ncbi:hypothetical protein D9611_000551 [Ephemerocybe angulata]|uniref:Uncharacterized protein n=1 Tax=Ephemerocybe angulata TaxID=980116 RepID=A0A8H5F7T9_9AGAR|nr:hypothetical protein D9611_000551 [Tulosesus angulatus]
MQHNGRPFRQQSRPSPSLEIVEPRCAYLHEIPDGNRTPDKSRSLSCAYLAEPAHSPPKAARPSRDAILDSENTPFQRAARLSTHATTSRYPQRARNQAAILDLNPSAWRQTPAPQSNPLLLAPQCQHEFGRADFDFGYSLRLGTQTPHGHRTRRCSQQAAHAPKFRFEHLNTIVTPAHFDTTDSRRNRMTLHMRIALHKAIERLPENDDFDYTKTLRSRSSPYRHTPSCAARHSTRCTPQRSRKAPEHAKIRRVAIRRRRLTRTNTRLSERALRGRAALRLQGWTLVETASR